MSRLIFGRKRDVSKYTKDSASNNLTLQFLKSDYEFALNFNPELHSLCFV